MGLFSNIFSKKKNEEKVGGMEDFMSLVRVYFQASLAANLNITNLGMLPDLRMFKATLHVPTVNNKLGLGEKNHCRKMMKEIYGTDDLFFKEIDQSIRKNCHKLQDVQTYMIQFQGFSQDLMMLMGNLMKWKFRMPGFFHKALRNLTAKQINDILTKNTWKDEGVRKACISIRQYQAQLGYSAEWMTSYVYNVVMLAKKEPKSQEND